MLRLMVGLECWLAVLRDWGLGVVVVGGLKGDVSLWEGGLSSAL